jgi:hypothetical protein
MPCYLPTLSPLLLALAPILLALGGLARDSLIFAVKVGAVGGEIVEDLFRLLLC